MIETFSGKKLGTLRFPLTFTELRKLRGVCEQQNPKVVLIRNQAVAKICMDHEPDFYRIMKTILPEQAMTKIYTRDRNLVLFKKIEPYKSIRTMKDALDKGMCIKQILRQVILLIQYAHSVDPYFSHNDMKADNILIAPFDKYKIGEHEFHDYGVVLIDFETVTGSKFPIIHVNATPQLLSDFGLDKSMPFSKWSDLHLVFMEIYQYKDPEFLEMCDRIAPGAFLTFKQGNTLVSKENRLNARGRHFFNTINIDLLQDPYFASTSCRDKVENPSD